MIWENIKVYAVYSHFDFCCCNLYTTVQNRGLGGFWQPNQAMTKFKLFWVDKGVYLFQIYKKAPFHPLKFNIFFMIGPHLVMVVNPIRTLGC